MKRPTMILIALLALAGCRFGPSPQSFRLAQRPEGAEAVLRLGRQNLRGELLALREAGLVVLAKDELVFVPFEAIRQGRFAPQRSPQLRNGRRPNEQTYEALRLVSRFPQGLREDVLAQLLNAYGQDELTLMR